MAETGPYINQVEGVSIAQSAVTSARVEITQEINTKVLAGVNSVGTGTGNLLPTDTVPANIKTFNLSLGTYTNLSGIVVSTDDLAQGVVQARQNQAGTWDKVIIPIPISGYVNKSTDLTFVNVPASINIFNKAAIPDANRGKSIDAGLGSIATSSSSDTSDYIDISGYAVGTTFLFRSLSTGKGARRFATYNASKAYVSAVNSSQEPERLFYTKQSTNEAFMRLSINFDAIADFQVEVAAVDSTSAPTPYVPFKAATSYLKQIAGINLPQFVLDNMSVFIAPVAPGGVLPTPITGKLIALLPGTYTNPNATTITLATKSILGWNGITWEVATTIPEAVTVETEVIPASKNIFNKDTIPVDNRGHSVNVGLGSLQTSSTSDTSDYIDISAYPVGTVFAMKSQLTGKGAIRSAMYTANKGYFNGTSVSGELFSKTKDSATQAWMRVSIPFASIDDFQVEVDTGNGSTQYVPFSTGKTVVKTINGAQLPTATATTTTTTTVADPQIIMSLNLLDTSTVISNKKINKTTGITEAATGYSVTDFITVKPNQAYSVWTYYALDRAIAWYDASKALVGFNTFSTQKATFTAPATAAYAQLDYAVNGGSVNRYIFTAGKDANVWMGFTKGLTSANKAANKTYGKKLWVFGASVSNTRTDLYEANWPNYAAPLGFAQIQNFSIPGASFRGTTGNNGAQQLNQAIAEGHDAPDFILWDLGTNDGLDNIGDWQTAINKVENVDTLADLDALDLTKTYEAALYCFYKARFLYPTAKLYATTFYQKAKPASLASYRAQPLIDAIKKVAQYANVLIMDQFTELGVVAAFETIDTDGLYLRDGQHPNTDGMKLEANFFIRKFLNSLV